MTSCDNKPEDPLDSAKTSDSSSVEKQTFEWIKCLEKKTEYRSDKDLEIIYEHLITMKALRQFPPYFIRQMCTTVCYENLRSGIVLYCQGNLAANWYTVLSGSLQEASVTSTKQPTVEGMCDANVDWEKEERELTERGAPIQSKENKSVKQRLKHSTKHCTVLTDGSVFGDSSVDKPRRTSTVVTTSECQLLYMDQRDYRALWKENQEFLQDLHISTRETSLLIGNEASSAKLTGDAGVTFDSYPSFSNSGNDTAYKTHPSSLSPSLPTSQERSKQSPFQRGASISRPEARQKCSVSEEMLRFGIILCETIKKVSPNLFKTQSGQVPRNIMMGSEMVSWMSTQINMDDRQLSLGMWQALIEEGVVINVSDEIEMRDGTQEYYFHEKVYLLNETILLSSKTTLSDDTVESLLQSVFNSLKKISPDALFRMILRKPSKERLPSEVEFVFGELLHIQALSHLSTAVKRQLASVLIFEAHLNSGKALFRQGDEGYSWYIILKGSVHVYIQGKGIVCTLHEGDDFGKLALVNNAPRAATIVLCEDNCHFLRVDKDDFNRILRDVEANTVRLKEHGTDVLILEKISTTNNPSAKCLYSVKAGTPEKVLEHLLETRLDISEDFISILTNTKTAPDVFVEDFILTYPIFISTLSLCKLLHSYLQMENPKESNFQQCTPTSDFELNEMIRNKRHRVIHFLFWWYRISNTAFTEECSIQIFTDELKTILLTDNQKCPSNKFEIEALDSLLYTSNQDLRECSKRSTRRNRMSFKTQSSPKTSIQITERPQLRFGDLTEINIFSNDSESISLKLILGSTVTEIMQSFANKKGCATQDLCLFELRSSGERVILKENDLGIITSLSVNGRLFITSKHELKNVHPLPDQVMCLESSSNFLDIVNIDDLALQITAYDWELFQNVHFYELIYLVFGRFNFKKISGNLDLVIREFSLIQFWVVTELCLITTLNKRVTILKRFIKLASKLLFFKNMNSFFAVMLGLNNSAVSRLQLTWDKLPNKYSKLFSELCSMLDPSRNHRVFRQTLDKTQPPIIPFLALLMKDMTFTHEGNKTRLDSLINFEKMELIARNLRVLINCRSKPLHLDGSSSREKAFADIKSYVRQLRCIDDQRVLTEMSKRLEPRKGNT